MKLVSVNFIQSAYEILVLSKLQDIVRKILMIEIYFFGFSPIKICLSIRYREYISVSLILYILTFS